MSDSYVLCGKGDDRLATKPVRGEGVMHLGPCWLVGYRFSNIIFSSQPLVPLSFMPYHIPYTTPSERSSTLTPLSVRYTSVREKMEFSLWHQKWGVTLVAEKGVIDLYKRTPTPPHPPNHAPEAPSIRASERIFTRSWYFWPTLKLHYPQIKRTLCVASTLWRRKWRWV